MARTLEALVNAAVDATGAELGFVAAVRDGGLQVVAAAGPTLENRPPPGSLVGQGLDAGGTAAWVVASGQPVAAQLAAGDERVASEALLLGGEAPRTVLCVPCAWDDEPLGALQLLNKYGGGKFSFDDVEVATLLGTVAGAALAEGTTLPAHRSAAELGAELRRLEGADPTAFSTVAVTLEALLGRA